MSHCAVKVILQRKWKQISPKGIENILFVILVALANRTLYLRARNNFLEHITFGLREVRTGAEEMSPYIIIPYVVL